MLRHSGKFYKDGYNIALENAKSLVKVAQNSADTNEFGIACSLNILAAEEAIKAVVILTRHYFPQMDTDEFKETFKSHNKKHKSIQLLTFISKYFIDSIYAKYEENKYYFDVVNQLPEETANEIKEKYKYFYKTIESVKKHKNKSDKFDEAIKWWEEANLVKNRGFYVDIVNNKWHNPRTFTKDQFDREKQYTIDLIEYIETFNTVVSPIKLIRELKRNSKTKY
ncbi:MAG: AbiV family abortive infection protein [Bacteroidales bacterium]|nr:AbiV family abortive infection protein [Bacteroidales bacterium]